MTFFTYIFSGILSVIGLVLLLYFARMLLEPAFSWFFSQRNTKGLNKLHQQLERFDAMMAEKKHAAAVAFLETAMSYDLISGSEIINQLKRHYQNILSRAVVLADEKKIEIEFLAETEHLLLERIDLLLLNDNVSAAYSRVQSKREQLGKEIPDWTKNDFKKRLDEVKKELVDNKTALSASFKRLLASLRKESTGTADDEDSPIVYH